LFGQQVHVDFVVAVLEEDRLAPVATLGNMMRKPRNHNTSEPSHVGTIAPRTGNRGIGIMSPYFLLLSRKDTTRTTRFLAGLKRLEGRFCLGLSLFFIVFFRFGLLKQCLRHRERSSWNSLLLGRVPFNASDGVVLLS
jgi:hypothetical protein